MDDRRNDDESLAMLRRILDQGEISDTHFHARLARIDGRAVPGNRRTFELSPGKHTLAFERDVESLHTYERGGPGPIADDMQEKTLDVELEAGGDYLFGAAVENFTYAGWQPFVVEAGD